MAEYVRTSTSQLSDIDRMAMGEYLKSIPADSRLHTGIKEVHAVAQQGAVLYLDNCGGCHQAKGRGIPGVVPPLLGNGAVNAPDPSNVIHVVLEGALPHGNYHVPMQSFSEKLTDGQIADIANYVRTSWGNAAPANATAKTVATLRLATK
jgi:mono/diheme cytochrome c family protein